MADGTKLLDPEASERTARILGKLINEWDIRGNLIKDARLAALAIEHGVSVISVDSDFARFSEIRWINPPRPVINISRRARS